MHQYTRDSLFQSAPPHFGDEDGRISLLDMVGIFRRSRHTILRFGALFLAGAVTYAFMTEPIFTAVAQVMLEPSQARDMLDDTNRPALAVDQARIESHIEILKSEQLALDVVRKLQLDKLPEFDAPKGESDRDGYAVVVFERNLSARRVGQSLVIEISFRFRDPGQAAAITNALVESYIAREMQVKADSVERADKWLYDKQASLDKQTQAALAELERYKAEPQGASAAKIEELQSRAQMYQRMHDAFLQKFNEAIQKVAFPEPDARIISPAAVPLQKSFPKRGVIIGLGALLGIGIGIIVAVVRQNLDRTVRSPSQLNGAVDCFGVVSEFPARAAIVPVSAKRANGRSYSLLRKPQAIRDPVLHFAADHPSSTVANQLRSIKVALDCSTDGQKSQLIGVVAAREREGATTLASNLAAVYAAGGLRTLIVDSCPDNPTLTREFFGAGEEPVPAHAHGDALTSVQMGEGAPASLSVLRVRSVPYLEKMGHRDRSRPPGELDALRETYQMVIFDLPGLARSSDARVIARFLDAIIVVAETGSTPVDAVHSAAAALRTARAPVIGFVLNKVRLA
jgi:succinoglycan biosynthesis transport protein ExoP